MMTQVHVSFYDITITFL